MNDDRMQVLKMVQEGKITPEEAAKLLSALEDGNRPPGRPAADGKKRWFRVRITDLKTGKRKVNVNIPMGLVDVGMRLGARFGERRVPEMGEIDYKELMEAVRSGAEGKLVDIDDEESGDHVEVYVE